MQKFKVTYSSNNGTNSVIVKARSIESARAEEEKAVAMFARINPSIRLESIEAI
jgi:hypothetical protein